MNIVSLSLQLRSSISELLGFLLSNYIYNNIKETRPEGIISDSVEVNPIIYL